MLWVIAMFIKIFVQVGKVDNQVERFVQVVWAVKCALPFIGIRLVPEVYIYVILNNKIKGSVISRNQRSIPRNGGSATNFFNAYGSYDSLRKGPRTVTREKEDRDPLQTLNHCGKTKSFFLSCSISLCCVEVVYQPSHCTNQRQGKSLSQTLYFIMIRA